jgi:hypothetical protein
MMVHSGWSDALKRRMNHVTPFPAPRRVPAVEPDLLGSAVFLFSEYLAGIAAEVPDAEDGDDTDAEVEIDTRGVLDTFAENLGTNVTTTLTLYLRVTALYRLLASSPSLAGLAVDQEAAGGMLTEDALLAAARLDLHVNRKGSEGAADFDPREFRDALKR